MIRYKDKVYEDYFIDEKTAIITDKYGNEIKPCKCSIKALRPCVIIKCVKLFVHCVQAHTKWGYKQGFDVHHKDYNSLNNGLNNLLYITHEEHQRIHAIGRHPSDESRKKNADAHRNKSASIKTKLKMSDSQSRRWKQRREDEQKQKAFA